MLHIGIPQKDNHLQVLSKYSNNCTFFNPDIPIDDTWNVDNYECVITEVPDEPLFTKATEVIMRYQFYPDERIAVYGDFVHENKKAQPGNVILEKLMLITDWVAVYNLMVITSFIIEPSRMGITVFSTNLSFYDGEFTAVLTRNTTGKVSFFFHRISKLNKQLPAVLHPYIRTWQRSTDQKMLEKLQNLPHSKID